MKKNVTMILLLIGIMFIAGCVGQTPQGSQQSQAAQPEKSKSVTIEADGFSFSPSSMTINKGDTVRWVSSAQWPVWPAGDVHPTHAAYPLGGGCIGSTFDACTGLKSGESWSFIFNEAGTWNYHDHMDPTVRGTIIVR